MRMTALMTTAIIAVIASSAQADRSRNLLVVDRSYGDISVVRLGGGAHYRSCGNRSMQVIRLDGRDRYRPYRHDNNRQFSVGLSTDDFAFGLRVGERDRHRRSLRGSLAGKTQFMAIKTDRFKLIGGKVGGHKGVLVKGPKGRIAVLKR